MTMLALALGEARAYAGESMAWQDVARAALANNIEVRAESERVEARNAARFAAYGGYMPSVSLVASKSDANTTLAGAVSKKQADEYGAEVKWSIFSGFSTTANVERGKADERGQEAIRDTARVDVRYELRTAYFQALAASENVELYLKIRDRQKDNVALMRLKYSSGAEALWSLRKAEADLAEAEQRLLDQENVRDRALDRLKFLMGVDMNFDLRVGGRAEDYLLPASFSGGNLSNHPRALAREARVEAANATVKLARSDFFPRLSAAYSYKKQKNDPSPNRVSVQTIGLFVEFPIFDGFSTKRNVESAAADRAAAELDAKNTVRELDAQFRALDREYRTRLKAVPVAEKAHSAARNRARVISEQYKLGLKRFLDWEQAQAKLIEAERDEIAVKLSALLARAELERAYGLKLGDE